MARTSGEVVAFLDDDACATPDWLEALIVHFADPAVAGVGGRVDPLWATARPSWFPGEFDWTVGASYSGMPETTAQVRNVWSNNMALRRAAFDAAGGFREDFGKVGAASRPEDTELCLRVTSGSWLYEPTSAVAHWVPAQRATLRYFLRRCFDEGKGKAEIAVMDGAANSTSAERCVHGAGAAAARSAADCARRRRATARARFAAPRSSAASAWPRPASPSAACRRRPAGQRRPRWPPSWR